MPPQLVKLSDAAPLARVSMVLWGSAGCGKTTLAATAPGKILLINFDNDGYQSLSKDDNIFLLDMVTEPNTYVCEQAKTTDPFSISTILKENPEIQTVIIDSITKFAERATINAVGKAPGSTFDNPGLASYGYRNRYTLQLVSNLILATARYNRNIIFICHEDVPKTDEKGTVLSITVLLGGSLPVEVPLQLSEVWHMRDNGSERSVIVREIGLRKPMKSRMFDTTTGLEFVTSDKKNPSKVRLDSLFESWKANNYDKIKLPS